MMLKELLFLLILSGSTLAQILRRCPGSLQCVDRFQCPEYVRLTRERPRSESLSFVRQNICSVFNRVVHVCCESFQGTAPDPLNPPSGNTNSNPSIISNPIVPDHGNPGMKPVLLPGVPSNLDSSCNCSSSTQPPAKLRATLPEDCGDAFLFDKIITGEKTVLKEMPWMATIGFHVRNRGVVFDCGASVIHPRYVLTAAHCVISSAQKIPVFVRLGEWNMTGDPDCTRDNFGIDCALPVLDVNITKIIIHPDYNKRYNESDDIALLEIATTLDFDGEHEHIRPICLPQQGVKPPQGGDPTVMGWGLTEHHNTSNILLKARTMVVNDSICISKLGELGVRYGDKQICTQPMTLTGSCSGDSGGPLILPRVDTGPPYVQIGLVSYGADPCINDEFPSVYTAVNQYVDWMLENMQD